MILNNKKYHFFYPYTVFFFLLIVTNCTKRVRSTYCDQFTSEDSLIQCIVTCYDEEALIGLDCCFGNKDVDLYRFFVADSTGRLYHYQPTYTNDGNSVFGLSDTITLFYEMKFIAMTLGGGRPCIEGKINFPDSIRNIIYNELSFDCSRIPTFKAQREYAKELNNIDSLYNEILSLKNLKSYNILRSIVRYDSLQPMSIEIVNKFHYPVACYDVYKNSVSSRISRLSDEDFKFAYSYLCEAADSMYYPAVFIKAGLCLTGAYFPQDTVLGKKLLEQCHATITIPFWQQYSKPPVYQHLLEKK